MAFGLVITRARWRRIQCLARLHADFSRGLAPFSLQSVILWLLPYSGVNPASRLGPAANPNLQSASPLLSDNLSRASTHNEDEIQSWLLKHFIISSPITGWTDAATVDYMCAWLHPISLGYVPLCMHMRAKTRSRFIPAPPFNAHEHLRGGPPKGRVSFHDCDPFTSATFRSTTAVDVRSGILPPRSFC